MASWAPSLGALSPEEDVQESFRAIAAAAGGEEGPSCPLLRVFAQTASSLEEQGLKAVERNLALMVFLPKQIAASAEAELRASGCSGSRTRGGLVC